MKPQLTHYFNFLARVAALTLFLFPPLLRAQCQPTTTSSPVPANQNASTAQPEFFDEPQFTVAGVTDTSNPAGHGSTSWRTSDALAKQTISLGNHKESPASSASLTEQSLREAAHQPGNFDANRLLGKLLLDEGKPREAVPYLEQAAQLKPNDYENAYELAVAYEAGGDYQNSTASTKALLARQNRTELHHLLGEDEENLGNPLVAVHEYQRAAELEPTESNLFDWGAELLLHHAPEPGAEVFAKGTRLFPHSSRMLIGLGVAQYARGSYDQAAACLCQASDLNPNDANPYLFLGKILNDQLMPSDGTVERLRRFATLQPESAIANYYYALGLWKQGKTPQDTEACAQIESLLQKAAHLDPTFGAAYLQLGILYSERGETSKALSAYQKAVETDPTLEAAHYRLAQMYRQTRDTQNAKQELEVYERLSKQKTEQAERERRELQQFVYTLRGPASETQPK